MLSISERGEQRRPSGTAAERPGPAHRRRDLSGVYHDARERVDPEQRHQHRVVERTQDPVQQVQPPGDRHHPRQQPSPPVPSVWSVLGS